MSCNLYSNDVLTIESKLTYDIMRSMTERYRFFFEITALFFLSLVFFLYGQATQEVIAFESRFYLFALEMGRYGVSFFPSTYQHFYPDYPATSTVLIYTFAKLFGTLNKLIAVLPSAIAAALTLVMTYAIAELHSKRWGLAAVFLSLLTLTFFKSARSITLDVYPTLITTSCFYLIYSADLKNKSSRSWWIYLLLIAGFAFRGPIGFIIPTGVICSYYLFDGQFKKCLSTGFLALLLLCICSFILLLIAYHVDGIRFMESVLHMQVLGRMDDSHIPLSFYFIKSFSNYALSFPLAVFTLFGVSIYAFKKNPTTQEVKLLLKLFGWVLIILIGMSIPGDKKIRYILPIVPATALIAAYLYSSENKKKYSIFLRLLTLIFFCLPAMFILLSAIVFYYSHKHAIEIYFFPTLIILLILQLINVSLFYRKKDPILILGIAAISFMCTYIASIEPIILYTERARDFVCAIEKMRIQTHSSLVFYKEKPDGLPIKYMIHTSQETRPIFIESTNELAHFAESAFFVSSKNNFADFKNELKSKFKIVANHKLGHVNVIVFTKKEK